MFRVSVVVSPALILCTVLASAQGAGIPAFSDRTADAQISAVHQPVGTHSFTAGGAVGDFNRDGWQDIYFVNGGGSADKLYLNNQDGTFSDGAAEWGLGMPHRGTAAVVGDYDGDGWLDVYVTSLGPTAQPATSNKHMLLRNAEGAGFEDMAAFAGVNALTPAVNDGFGAAFGDYDLDGDLDLAVASWDGSNRLFRNDGDGTFSDATLGAGLGSIDGVFGFAPRFADMDDDGWPELLLVGDFSTSMYFINDGDGTFTDFTAQSGTSQDGTEMGHTIADFNGDGLFDWYVTTITNNNLYINQGHHEYTNMASSAGVVDTGWGWATAAIDIDHDGRADIVATSQDSGQYVFLNSTTQPSAVNFQNLTNLIGLDSDVSGRGLASLDYDNDGDQDVVIFPREDPLKLFRNDLSGTDTNWLRVFLDTSGHDDLPPGGVGSTVYAIVDGVRLMQRVDGGSNYLSHSEMSAHFGLGPAAVVQQLEVAWTNGQSTVLTNVEANRTVTLTPDDVSPCGSFEDCADTDADGRRDDACMWWSCDAGTCLGSAIAFADMGGFNGSCLPDGTADSNDRFHALNCFSNVDTLGEPGYGCEVAAPAAFNVDAGGEFGNCSPDGVCDANDAFHAINSFSGLSTCACPAPPAPAYDAGPRIIDDTVIRLRARQRAVTAGQDLLVDAYLDEAVSDLRGYQLHVGWRGGQQGRLHLVDMYVDDRGSQALGRAQTWSAFNLQTMQMACGTDGPGVSVPAGAYLATFVLRPAASARGRFVVELLHGDNSDQRTFLFATPPSGKVALRVVRGAIIDVRPARGQATTTTRS